MNDLAKHLQAPFREDEYEWRAQKASAKGDKVLVLCYVKARAIMNRLDEVFGPLGWGCEYEPGADGGVLCNLWAWTENGRKVSKADGADNTKIEPVKGGISSALKRAGSAWGIGRLLYKLKDNWVALKAKGEHWFKYPDKHDMHGKYAYWDSPKLPPWAVSERNPKTQPNSPPATPIPPDPAPTTEKKPIGLEALRRSSVEYIKSFPTDKACLDKIGEKYLIDNETDAFVKEVRASG